MGAPRKANDRKAAALAAELISRYDRTRLRLREVAKELGIAYNTARKWRTEGRFPVYMSGQPLTADVRDLAEYLASLQEKP